MSKRISIPLTMAFAVALLFLTACQDALENDAVATLDTAKTETIFL